MQIILFLLFLLLLFFFVFLFLLLLSFVFGIDEAFGFWIRQGQEKTFFILFPYRRYVTASSHSLIQ